MVYLFFLSLSDVNDRRLVSQTDTCNLGVEYAQE